MNQKRLFTLFACIVVALAVAASAGAQAKKSAPAANEDNLMDLNSAPPEKLMTLNPIVDLIVAKKIIAGRPYQNKTQVVTKKIMTQENFDKIARQVTAKPQPKDATAAKGKKG